MAFDTERAARRLTDAGLEERAANGVADVVGDATSGLATEARLLATEASLDARLLATEASLQQSLAGVREEVIEVKADLAAAKAEWKADIEGLKFPLFAGLFAVTGIILAAMRLWV